MTNGEKGNGQLFSNWRRNAVLRVLQTLMISGITGLVIMYGTTEAMKVQIANLIKNVECLQAEVKGLSMTIAGLTARVKEDGR
jgi:hypothetical protein